MKIQRFFEPEIDRYAFDFKYATPSKGWAQIDSEQDAWYYGQWANPIELRYISYAEGDITLAKADSPEAFVDYIRMLKKWSDDSGYKFKIDPMGNEGILAAFVALGLGDLLH